MIPEDVLSGFFPRFLLFSPPSNDKIPDALPRRTQINYKEQEQQIMNILQEAERTTCRYVISKEGATLFERIHNEILLIPKSYDNDSLREILDAYVKRWGPYVLKLSIIMQTFYDPQSLEISQAAIEAAYAIIKPAISSTQLLFEEELSESAYDRNCKKVYSWICKRIQRYKQPVTWAQISTSKTLNGETKDYDSVVQTLIDRALINVTPAKNKKEKLYTLCQGRVNERQNAEEAE